MNDSDREEWIANDEGLYDMQRKSGKGMTSWIRANRKLIDEVADNVKTSKQPAHYLKYGGNPERALF